MAKQIYYPSLEETKAMYICNKNDVAYVMQPIGKLYKIIKFKISDYLRVITLKENNKELEFTEFEASKKIMQLYTNQSKAFI